MAIVDLVMPKMGESIMEATILKWHKRAGDFIKLDEIVLDIATDKVDSEIPSSVEGVLKEVFFNVNDVVSIGTVLARIETVSLADYQHAEPVKVETPVVPVKEEVVRIPVIHEVHTPAPETVQESKTDFVPFAPIVAASRVASNNRFFSPLVLNIANSEGLGLSELEYIVGTGAENRVTKKDILQYIADKKAGKVQPVAVAPVYHSYTAPVVAPVQVEPVKPPVVEEFPVQVIEHKEEVKPVAEHDTSAFIKQEVSLPVNEPVVAAKFSVVEDVAIASAAIAVTAVATHEEEIRHAFKTDDIPVAVAPAIPAPVAVVEPAKEAFQHSVEEEVYVSAPVQTVHTAPVNVHIEEVAPKETFVHLDTVNIPPVQNVVTPVVAADMPGVEIIEMDRMRKYIAKHMVDSKHTSPHVTSFAEADVTNMVQWRDRVKGDFEKREGVKLTFTPMFIECIVNVLKRYPLINSSVDGDKIIIKKFFNIGFATSLPTGNLIVPVIKGAQNHTLVSLTHSVSSLAENARNQKLKPDDTSGGTFTFSNLGNFGSLMGTPIINQPQSAIMAVGAIKKRAVVIETDKGDFIGIRQMMFLSLSYDHRIIDGSVGASFLTDVAKEFEKWNPDREL